ncbi:MAG TPA: galactose-1-phosphate uridylyltransferase [bacterium]|nr:galactose-1-phosphate uridylyltransferase [bacterium]
MPELRKDPITERWVIISPERAKRPEDFTVSKAERKEGVCPFCQGNESMTPEEVFAIREGTEANSQGWKTRVVPNKFAALAEGPLPELNSNGIYKNMAGHGTHEVIVETPKHSVTLADLGVQEISDFLKTCTARFDHMKKLGSVKYAMLFRNNGQSAGASREHPHSQIIGLPITPKALSEEITPAKEFNRSTGGCIFCKMLDDEIKQESRIVLLNEKFAAICPFAPHYAFETWILPRRHESSFENISDSEITCLAEILKSVLTKMKQTLKDPPYNMMLHTSPFGENLEGIYHWHIEIAPSLNIIAGFERGTDFYINPTPPETAAEYLRKA